MVKLKDKLIQFWPYLMVLLLVMAFAFPYWAKGKVPFPADYLVDAFIPWQYYYAHPVKNNAMPDVVSQMVPWKHLVINFWQQGQIPLWNPYNFSGGPFLANYQSAVFHPANWLFFLLPEIEAWSLLILLQPLLAGWFTYLFGRQLGLSKPASLISALAFMFCGFITTWMAYGTMAWALLWLPLILYGIQRSFSRVSFWSLAVIAFGLGASFFSGHFQISLYVLLGTLGFLIYLGLATRKKKAFFLCLALVILGVLLASIQILPALELYQYSVRGHYLGISEIIPWQYSPTLMAPDFYGNAVTRNDWFGHYAEWSGFTGVIPLILAFYALLRKRKKTSLFFVFLALFSILMSRPSPFLDLIVKLKIPVFSSSAAARINSLWSFSVAILAGFGFQQLIQDLKAKKIKIALGVAFFFFLLMLCLWGILFIGQPFEVDQIDVAQRNLVLPTGTATFFLSLILGFFFVSKLFKKKTKLLRSALFLVILGLLSLTAFDMFRFAQKWMPFDSRQHWYPSLPILEFLSQKANPERVFGYFGMEMQNYYQIPGFNGYDPLYLERYGELLTSADHGQIRTPSTRGVSLGRRSQHTLGLLNLMGGKYILYALPDKQNVWAFNHWDYPDQFKKIYQDETYEVYENLKALPRAFMVYDYQVVQEPQAIINQLYSSATDLRRTVILEKKPTLEIENAEGNRGKVTVKTYLSSESQLKVETNSPGLLFISDNYYPGWQALVDGRPVPIYRANYTFRAVEVPQGNHEVKFIYQPLSFKIGMIVSFLALLSGLLLAKFKGARIPK